MKKIGIIIGLSAMLSLAFAGAAFAESKTYVPSEEELVTIFNAKKDPSVSESKKQEKSEDPEKAVIKIDKETDGKLVISWKSDAEKFHVMLTSSSGNPVFTETTEKKSVTVSDLNPGEIYTFSIVSEINGNQSDEIKKEIRTLSETNRIIAEDEEEASEMIRGSIVNAGVSPARKGSCVFFLKKNLNGNIENMLDSAFNKIENGKSIRNDVSVFFESADARNYGDFEEDYVIDGEKYTKYSFGFTYLTTKKQDAEYEKELKKTEEELGLKGFGTEQDKVLDIVRFVQNHVADTTDTSGLNNTAYGALINGKATCGGRAALVNRLLDSAGIRNAVVNFENPGSSHFPNAEKDKEKNQTPAAMQHSINSVFLSGKMIMVDTNDENCMRNIEFFGM